MPSILIRSPLSPTPKLSKQNMEGFLTIKRVMGPSLEAKHCFLTPSLPHRIPSFQCKNPIDYKYLDNTNTSNDD